MIQVKYIYIYFCEHTNTPIYTHLGLCRVSSPPSGGFGTLEETKEPSVEHLRLCRDKMVGIKPGTCCTTTAFIISQFIAKNHKALQYFLSRHINPDPLRHYSSTSYCPNQRRQCMRLRSLYQTEFGQVIHLRGCKKDARKNVLETIWAIYNGWCKLFNFCDELYCIQGPLEIMKEHLGNMKICEIWWISSFSLRICKLLDGYLITAWSTSSIVNFLISILNRRDGVLVNHGTLAFLKNTQTG